MMSDHFHGGVVTKIAFIAFKQRNHQVSILLHVPSLEDLITLVQIDLGMKPSVRDDDEAH